MTKTIISSCLDIDDNDENELIFTKTLFRRHSIGPVMFNGCSPSGDVIIVDNISSKKTYDLAGWYIERETDAHPMLRYTFTDKFILPPLTTVELWSNVATPVSISQETVEQQQQQAYVIIKTKLLTWNNARQWSITRLFDPTGREKAIFSHRTVTQEEEEAEEQQQSE